MVAALLLAGVLFIVQTWVAALLVPDPETLISKGDPGGTAFYDAAAVAGGAWLSKLTALATAIAWGFANALVAQAATSRLLYAMARDRQLPSFLARIHPTKGVPTNATLLVAVVSLGVGFVFYEMEDGITTLSTLVNFGALTAFLALHVSVVWHYVGRRGSRRWWTHLVAPVIGFAILAYVLVNAQVYAQGLALIWFVVGLVIMVVLVASGRTTDLKLPEEETR
jgi:amino acid transporter